MNENSSSFLLTKYKNCSIIIIERVRDMRIIVDSLPEEKSECLFSYHSCEYGWLCRLYRSKETDIWKRMRYPETPKCEIENCPYLREESWFGINIE